MKRRDGFRVHLCNVSMSPVSQSVSPRSTMQISRCSTTVVKKQCNSVDKEVGLGQCNCKQKLGIFATV